MYEPYERILIVWSLENWTAKYNKNGSWMTVNKTACISEKGLYFRILSFDICFSVTVCVRCVLYNCGKCCYCYYTVKNNALKKRVIVLIWKIIFVPRSIFSKIVTYILTHWGRVTYIYVDKLTIIGSDNGLSPGRRQAIIWTSAGIFLIRPLGRNFSEILIGIQTFSFKKMYLKMSSAR